jgi:putative transposase
MSDAERALALARLKLLRPFLDGGVPLTTLAKENGIPIRTARRWVTRYRTEGLAGLARKARSNNDRERIPTSLKQLIEGLALQKPRLSAAAVHRKVISLADKLKEAPPSYSTVYRLIQRLDPALLSLAHEGSKAYGETFDLLHRTEASASNAIWQADHSHLDIWLKDERGDAKKPWLTIILDDYSRAVSGYFVTFSAPSALQTSLALRQAIWRKENPAWHVCGIPGILYTDHGSDFTSEHIEQVAADLKIQLIFSAVGRPRGRGKIERFFETLAQVFLSRLPGYAPSGKATAPKLTLPAFSAELEAFIVGEYLVTPHSTTKVPPQARWEASGFLPQMPDSLEKLDLLLLTVPKMRRVHQDGIRFMGMRYIDPTLAAYVGEDVLLRYDPRDVAEVRLYFEGRFLCRAICQELAGESVSLREIMQARTRRRRELRQTLEERRRVVDSLLETRRWQPQGEEADPPAPTDSPAPNKLKRYFNE